MLRQFQWPKRERRIAQVSVGLAEVVGWLGLPSGVMPVSVRARDDGQGIMVTIVGDELDEVPWDSEPPIKTFAPTWVKQVLSVEDGGPDFERIAPEGSAGAEAIRTSGVAHPMVLAGLTAVREQAATAS